GEPRYDISGTVTYDGKPVPRGVILFTPDLAAKNDGLQGSAEIRDGAYDTGKAPGKGASGGKYVVRISGFDGTPGLSELPFGRPLFQDYEVKLDLPREKTTQNFTVPKDRKAK